MAKGGFDVVVDCVGAAPTKAQALRAARSGGSVVLLGLHDDASPLSSHEIIRRELMVTGSYTYVAFDVQQAIALLTEGAVRYDTWTERRPLSAGPDSFDCSGLAQYVWGKAGVYLAHYTGDQWNEGTHVSRDQLEPGDLVFFAYNTSEPSTIHHVGVYVGGGQMIDAPYTGVDVRKEPAFRSDYIGAVRPG